MKKFIKKINLKKKIQGVICHLSHEKNSETFSFLELA